MAAFHSVWVPCSKLRRIGPLESDEIKLPAQEKDSSCVLKAPRSRAISANKGRRLQIVGKDDASAAMVLRFVVKQISREQSFDDKQAKVWYYLNNEDKRFGPFSVAQLAKWHAGYDKFKNVEVQHGPSMMWCHISLLIAHSKETTDDSGVADMMWEEAWVAEEDLDELEATEMEMHIDELAALRKNEQFKEKIASTVAMDIDDATDVGQLLDEQLDLPHPMDVMDFETIDSLAAETAETTKAKASQSRVYLVLDTNVLLNSLALKALGRMRDMFGRGAARKSTSLELVALVPWMVLMELDGLKQGGGDDSGKGLAASARAAVNALREGLSAGDKFFQGQSLQEFKEAAKKLAGSDSCPDDHILQCCLDLKARLSDQEAAAEDNGPKKIFSTILLSNDNMLCVKAAVSGVKAVSAHQLPCASDTEFMEHYMMQLLHGDEETEAASSSSTTEPVATTTTAETVASPVAGAAAAAAVGGSTASTTINGDGDTDMHDDGDGPSTALYAKLEEFNSILGPKLVEIMKEAYEELWEGLVIRRPPWKGDDVLAVLHKHWDSTFSSHVRQPRDAKMGMEMLDKLVRFNRVHNGDNPSVVNDFAGQASNLINSFGIHTRLSGPHSGGQGGAGAGPGPTSVLPGGVEVQDVDFEGPHTIEHYLNVTAAKLTPKLLAILEEEYGDLWTGIVVCKPPWSGADVFAVLIKHWQSSFAEHVRGARDLKEVVEQMDKTARYVLSGRGRPHRGMVDDFLEQSTRLMQSFGVQVPLPPPPPPQLPGPPPRTHGGPRPEGGGAMHEGGADMFSHQGMHGGEGTNRMGAHGGGQHQTGGGPAHMAVRPPGPPGPPLDIHAPPFRLPQGYRGMGDREMHGMGGLAQQQQAVALAQQKQLQQQQQADALAQQKQLQQLQWEQQQHHSLLALQMQARQSGGGGVVGRSASGHSGHMGGHSSYSPPSSTDQLHASSVPELMRPHSGMMSMQQGQSAAGGASAAGGSWTQEQLQLLKQQQMKKQLAAQQQQGVGVPGGPAQLPGGGPGGPARGQSAADAALSSMQQQLRRQSGGSLGGPAQGQSAADPGLSSMQQQLRQQQANLKALLSQQAAQKQTMMQQQQQQASDPHDGGLSSAGSAGSLSHASSAGPGLAAMGMPGIAGELTQRRSTGGGVGVGVPTTSGAPPGHQAQLTQLQAAYSQMNPRQQLAWQQQLQQQQQQQKEAAGAGSQGGMSVQQLQQQQQLLLQQLQQQKEATGAGSLANMSVQQLQQQQQLLLQQLQQQKEAAGSGSLANMSVQQLQQQQQLLLQQLQQQKETAGAGAGSQASMSVQQLQQQQQKEAAGAGSQAGMSVQQLQQQQLLKERIMSTMQAAQASGQRPAQQQANIAELQNMLAMLKTSAAPKGGASYGAEDENGGRGMGMPQLGPRGF